MESNRYISVHFFAFEKERKKSHALEQIDDHSLDYFFFVITNKHEFEYEIFTFRPVLTSSLFDLLNSIASLLAELYENLYKFYI